MKYNVIIILLAILLFGGCEKNPANDDSTGKKIIDELMLNPTSEEVIKASNQFGFKIFKEINADAEDDENLFISPTSISMALAMTYNGANGVTKDSIASVLQMKGVQEDELNQIYKDLTSGLTSIDNKVELSIANSIWYRQDFSVLDEFISTNEEYYDAEISPLDFNNPAAKDIINGWVEEKTNNKIKDLISTISPSHVMFLINAIYFNGMWQKEFDEEKTFTGDFYVNNSKNVEVQMMSATDTFAYYSNDLYQALELNYGYGNYSMVVLLPQQNISATHIIELLSPETWDELVENLHKKKVVVNLPKFKFEYEKKLNDILTRMGMGIAFDPGEADLSGINEYADLYIDYVKHKSFVEVDEKGTEAAAATVVAIEVTAIIDQPYFIVNRPFVFVIREKNTGALVFMGKVSDPSTE